MDNYVISDESEYIDAEPPFPLEILENVDVVEVSSSMKGNDVVATWCAMVKDTGKSAVLFKARCEDVERCISLVEVFKRELKRKSFQWNEVSYAKRIDFWDPMVDGLDRLKVIVEYEVLFILVSLNPFDKKFTTPGMQSSGEASDFVGSSQPTGHFQKTTGEGPRRLQRKQERNPWQRDKKSKPVSSSS